MWDPPKDDYDLLFSLTCFNAPAAHKEQQQDTLLFAAETVRDYLRWVVALARVCAIPNEEEDTVSAWRDVNYDAS
jgi:hypothetical protein